MPKYYSSWQKFVEKILRGAEATQKESLLATLINSHLCCVPVQYYSQKLKNFAKLLNVSIPENK